MLQVCSGTSAKTEDKDDLDPKSRENLEKHRAEQKQVGMMDQVAEMHAKMAAKTAEEYMARPDHTAPGPPRRLPRATETSRCW